MVASAVSSKAVSWSWRQPSVLPGLGLSLGITLTALSLVILIPLAALFIKAASAGPAEIWAIATSPRTLAALRLSFLGAFFAASVNAVFGLILAWVLVRYEFPGRRLVDAAVDLPFALPTAVAGIALAAIYAPNGWVGSLLAPYDIKIAYTPLGVMVALIFIGLPFVVRMVQPVLQEAQGDIEEAAALLGASRLRTIFKVVLPPVMPALLTGFVLAFARAVGAAFVHSCIGSSVSDQLRAVDVVDRAPLPQLLAHVAVAALR